MQDFDLIVIGAGPGGYNAAAFAANNGLRTALIEANALGGTCLNRGCIPTKSLLHASEQYRLLKKETELFTGDVQINEKAMFRKTFETVDSIRNNVSLLLKNAGVHVYAGKAQICGSHEVQVGDDNLCAKHILIATGSKPMRLPIEGIEHAVDSDGFFHLDAEKIEHLVIIGGGVIGVEMASIYNALGKKVTIIEALPCLIANMDKDMGKNLQAILKKRGVDILVNAKVTKIDTDSCTCIIKNKEMEIKGDAILVSTGRVANTEGLCKNPEMLAMDHGIVVDEDYRTSVDSIFAIGDVVSGSIKLAHAAHAEGRYVVERLLGLPTTKNPRLIPACVYVSPEIAAVGLNEEQGKLLGYASVKAPMHSNARTMIAEADRSLMKLVYDPKTRIVKGAHLMCERASDMIMEFATAINLSLTIDQLNATVRPHPSFCEAADDLFGKAK